MATVWIAPQEPKTDKPENDGLAQLNVL